MISYMVGKLAPNPTHFTGGLNTYVPGRGYFVPFPLKTGTNLLHPLPLSIVERVGSSTSLAAILYCFTVGTFILHVSSSLQTGSGAHRHPTALFTGPKYIQVHYIEDVTRPVGRQRAKGAGAGVRNGNGNSDGSGGE